MSKHPDQLTIFDFTTPETADKTDQLTVFDDTKIQNTVDALAFSKAIGPSNNASVQPSSSLKDMAHPAQFVIDRLLNLLDLPVPEELPEGSVCALTGAPIRLGYQQDNYGVTQTISTLSGCFTLHSLARLGLERMAKTTPVGYALCKIAGGKIIVPNDPQYPVEIWTGGKYIERLKGDFFHIKDCSGHAAMRALLDTEIDGAVFEMSLRIERVLKHFRVTTPDNLVLMTDKGALVIPRKQWSRFRDDFTEMNNKYRREFVTLAKSILSGKQNLLDEDIQKKLRHEGHYMDLLRLLPSSPQAAQVYLSAASVEGGKA